VTKVRHDQNDGLAGHSLWNGPSARRNRPASDGELIRQGAASIAAPHVPADASVDQTEARNAGSTEMVAASPTSG
jgi:hypothetical protein